MKIKDKHVSSKNRCLLIKGTYVLLLLIFFWISKIAILFKFPVFQDIPLILTMLFKKLTDYI